jgi:predicted DNA-binding antitoxin AbrB/MazE fold protein
MSQEYPAIYEGGIFRPLTALKLPEHTPVTVTVQGQPAAVPSTPVDLQSQQQALDAMFAAVDQLPQASPTDGLSNRDHDQILYGSR